MGNRIIDDNEPCPCGSGLLFKECCKGKTAIVNNSKKPVEVQIMDRMRASMKKVCLHPDKKNCKGKIKNAHALQNNKTISLLAGEERHVYMLNAKKKPLIITLKSGEKMPVVEIDRVSANDATAEYCFCDYHDDIVFAAIEKNAPDYESTKIEMSFVYAYKAFIFEYCKQWTSMEIFRKCFKSNPVIAQDIDSVGIYRMLQLRAKEFEPIKNFFDKQILDGTNDGIFTCSIKLPKQIKFADYAYIAFNYDLNGRKIHHAINGEMHRLAITIFPEADHSWLLMSCLENEKDIYGELFSQFQTATEDMREFYLNIMLPLYSENMVLSPKLWESWDDNTRYAYTYYANLHGPDALKMERALAFGLRNAARSKKQDAYSTSPKINLFL